MRLEDVTPEKITSLEAAELLDLRERANQLWESADAHSRELAKGNFGVTNPIPRHQLLVAYDLIMTEIEKRQLLDRPAPQELDHKRLRTRLRGFDPPELPRLMVKNAVVALAGDCVESPAMAKHLDVRIDADQFGDDGFLQSLERELVEGILRKAGGAVVRRDGVDLEGPVMPLYDLMLVPRLDAEQLDEAAQQDFVKRLHGRDPVESSAEDRGDGPAIEYESKSRAAEHRASLLDPDQFDEFTREDDKLGKGVSAVWGVRGGKTKLQAVRFDASEFSAEEAQEWLAEHNYDAAEFSTAEVPATKSFLKSEHERIVGGVVYYLGDENNVDAQGDFVDDPDEIWKALKSWMIGARAAMRVMHASMGPPL